MSQADEFMFEPDQIEASIEGFARILELIEEKPEHYLRDTTFRWEASPLLVSKLALGMAKQVREDKPWLQVGGDGGPPPSVKTWMAD